MARYNKDAALNALYGYLQRGMEWPDAHGEVCIKLNLSVKQGERLTADYDAHESAVAARGKELATDACHD